MEAKIERQTISTAELLDGYPFMHDWIHTSFPTAIIYNNELQLNSEQKIKIFGKEELIKNVREVKDKTRYVVQKACQITPSTALEILRFSDLIGRDLLTPTLFRALVTAHEAQEVEIVSDLVYLKREDHQSRVVDVYTGLNGYKTTPQGLRSNMVDNAKIPLVFRLFPGLRPGLASRLESETK